MAYRLKPVDYFSHDIVGADDTYLYRINHSGGGSFQRIPKADLATPETLTAWSAMPGDPYPQWARFATGTQLIILDDAGTPSVARSTDGGATWAIVQALNAQPLRNICIATVAGAEWALIGEYRTTGSGGEDVVLWQSTDDGVTWTALNTWTYEVETRHIHVVQQDPYTGLIYVGFGDTTPQSGIIRWDPLVGDWADVGDVAPADVNAVGFIGVGDSQKYRCTDICFDSEYAYHYADAGAGALAGDRGIHRFRKDLTGWERLNNDIEAFTEYAGCWCVMTDRGPVFINYVSAAGAVDAEISIWQFGHGTCERVGEFNCHDTTTTKNPRCFFVDDGRVYLSVAPAGGKGAQKQTAVFEVLAERFTRHEPDIVHPVFWVSKSGSDANSGQDPRLPKLTIRPTVLNTGAVIPYGACVMVGAGEFHEAGVTYGNFVNYVTSFPTEVGKPIQLRGAGRDLTLWNFASGTNGLTRADEDNLNLRLDDIEVTGTGITGSLLLGSVANYGTVIAHAATIGDMETDYAQTVYPRSSTFKAYRSKIRMDKAASNFAIRLTDAAPVTEQAARLYSCIVEGGEFCIVLDEGGVLEAYNTVIRDATTAGIITRVGLVAQPVVVNCPMHSAEAAWTPFDDNNSMTYTAIHHCLVDKTSSTEGVADAELGAGSSIVATLATAGVVYVDPSNDDYTPVEGSVAIEAGGALPYRFGYDGEPLKNPPTIGPVEYLPGVRQNATSRPAALARLAARTRPARTA